MLEKLMNTPPCFKRGTIVDTKRSKKMSQKFEKFNKGKTLIDRKRYNNSFESTFERRKTSSDLMTDEEENADMISEDLDE